jgi:hypothetical protein
MAFFSVTRLHLRSKRFLPVFLFYTWRSATQAKRSRGFLTGMIGNDPEGGNWTITAWDTEADMRAFRNASAHAVAMRKLLHWCDEASFTHYTADGATLPTAGAAYDHLGAGKTSKVNHPSPAHAGGRTVSASQPRFGLTLEPKR